MIVRILLFISLQSVFSSVAAQQQRRIDSLKSLLPGKTDLERADIFYYLADEYSDTDYILLAKYIEQSFQCAKRTGDSLRIVRAGRIKASAFRRLGELDSAITQGLAMLPIATRNSYRKEIMKILRGLAITYTFKADYALGLQYNFELLKTTEQDYDSLEMSYVLSNIGLVYFKLANHEKALQYYHRSLAVMSPLDKYPRTTTFVNMSLCYSVLKNFPRSNEFLRKGFAGCQPECPGPFMIEWLHAYGVFHFYKENLDSAEVYFLRAYSLARKLGNRRYQLIIALDLIDIYHGRNQTPLAAHYLSEADSIMQRSPFEFELLQLYPRFFSFYKKTGNDKKRAFYQEKYIQSRDSINNQLANNLMKIESDHLERKNKARIAEQEQLLALKDQVIRRQNALKILLGIVTLLLIALLYVLCFSNRQRRHANRLLDQKVKERTSALELNHRALKKSFDEEDVTIVSMFMEIKSSMASIIELCSLGKESEDGCADESRKYLAEILTVTGSVSLASSSIHGMKIEMKTKRD